MVNIGVSNTPRTPVLQDCPDAFESQHAYLCRNSTERTVLPSLLQKRRNSTQPRAPGLESAEILHHEILGLKSTISLQHCNKQLYSCLVCSCSISCSDNRCSLVQGGMLDRRGPGRSCLLLRQQFQ